MIEKAIAASLEPLIDSLVETEKKQAALEKRLADIQLKEGPAGRDGVDGADADPEAVAKALVEKHADLLRGADGADGKDADPEAVAKALVEHHSDLLRGADGKDADPVEVAKQAILLEEFTSVTTEAIKAMLAVRLQEEHDEVDAILD